MRTSYPNQFSEDRNQTQAQSNIASVLKGIAKNPILNGAFINSISLVTGNNTINHGLGRTLLGWIITGKNDSFVVYDKQAVNTTPGLTLVLNSSAPGTINLYVF